MVFWRARRNSELLRINAGAGWRRMLDLSTFLWWTDEADFFTHMDLGAGSSICPGCGLGMITPYGNRAVGRDAVWEAMTKDSHRQIIQTTTTTQYPYGRAPGLAVYFMASIEDDVDE